jgi:hypothetical protein
LDGARGKRRTTVAVAVARELSCFVWEIATSPTNDEPPARSERGWLPAPRQQGP